MKKPKPKLRIYRQYSDTEKAHALAALEANDGNVMLTAKELAMPEATLNKWGNGEVHPEVLQMCAEQREPLADRLEKIAHELADICPEKYQAASLQQVMTSLAIAVDKSRLLRGEPTSIQQKLQDTMTDEQLYQRLSRLADSLRDDQSQSPSVAGAGSGGSLSALGSIDPPPGTPETTK